MSTTYCPIGVNLTATSASPVFGLGQVAEGSDGSKWLYVKASGAITQYMWVGITTAWVAAAGTKAMLDDGYKVGFAQVAFADTEYGWVCIKGGNSAVFVKAKNSCLPNVDLYSSGTAGFVDDTSASQTLINGLVLTDTATSSGAAEEFFAPIEPFGLAS